MSELGELGARGGFRPRGIAILALVLAELLAPHLTAQTITTYPAAAAPIEGVAFDGTNIWLTSLGDNTVTKLLASTGTRVGTFNVGQCPQGIAFDGANIWTANCVDNTVTKLLASTGAIVGTYKVGNFPLAITFDGTNIWVTNLGSSTVTKLLAATGSTVGTYAVGSQPKGIAFDGANIWVANFGNDTVTKLLASTGANLGTYPVGAAPVGVAIEGPNLWVANEGRLANSGNITKLLAATGATLSTYAAGSNPYGIAFDGTNIWIANSGDNTVTKLLASSGIKVGTYSVGSEPIAILFDGTNIWTANSGGGSVTEISPTTSDASLSALKLAFGNQFIGFPSAQQSVTLTNSGTVPLNITGIGITGTNVADYAQTNTCGNSVAVHSNCVISVTFTPTGTGTRTASIIVTDSATSSPQVFTVTGTGQIQPAKPTLSALSFLFASQFVGFSSAQQSVALTNSGTVPLNITSIGITGTNAADYAQTNTCGSSLAAGSGCVIAVTFTPTAIGARTATVSIVDNASNSPQTIGLTGDGQTPPLVFTVGSNPQGITFDGTNIWLTSATNNTVARLLTSTGTTSGVYPVGTYPSSLISDGVSIWTANYDSATVTKLLASNGATVGTYAVGSAPTGLAFDGTNIWVANEGSNSVTKLLALTGVNVGTYPVGGRPKGIVFDGTNIWVANSRDNTVTKLPASASTTVGTYAVGSTPTGLAFDGTNIWVTNQSSNTVTKLLASSGANLGTFTVGNSPLGIAFDGTNIWTANSGNNTVTKLLASSGATVGVYPVGKQPVGVIFDGVNIWVANSGSNTVTKIGPASQRAPYISPAGVVPLDSTVNAIQPGEWVSIYGNNLSNKTVIWSGEFPTSLGDTSVLINGQSAYISLVSPGQINLQAPNDTTTGPVPVVVTAANGIATATVTLGQFAPSFALLDAVHVAAIIPRSDGSGTYGGGTYDILGPTGSSLGYATVAAKAGDTVELFGVGFGPTTPLVAPGQVFSGAAATTNGVQLRIGSTNVNPSFAGLSGAGLYQINVAIPAGVGLGDVPLSATVGGVQTQAGVVIALR